MIRPINQGDIHAIINLAEQMHGESPAYRDYPFLPEKVRGWVEICLQNPSWRCLIARNGTHGRDRPVGFMAAGAVDHLFSNELTVDDLALYVVPEHRGTMVGPLLLKHMIRWAKTTGASQMRCGITTEIDNLRVTALFERMGFRVTGSLCTLRF